MNFVAKWIFYKHTYGKVWEQPPKIGLKDMMIPNEDVNDVSFFHKNLY